MTKPVDILYENEKIIVFDKPSGIITIPSPDDTESFSDLVNSLDLSPQRLFPAHRLDKDTSGVIVYCKGKNAQKETMRLFANRDLSKIYLALIEGNIGKNEGILKTPVDGQEALSQFKVLGRSKNTSLLKVKIHTGRTNQIRVQCRDMGHPLIGDTRFGVRKEFSVHAKRTMLHSYYLAIGDIEVKSPLPADFLSILKDLDYPETSY